jgi:hypothetical protein
MATPQAPDFESLKRLMQFLSAVRRNHVRTMEYYLSDDGEGFFHQAEHRLSASRSSTATCIASLVHAGLWIEDTKWGKATNAIANKLIGKPWISSQLKENNPFTVSFVVEGILDLQEALSYPDASGHLGLLKTEAVPLLQKSIKEGAIGIDPYPHSAYLTQLAFRVLSRMREVPAGAATRIHDWASSEINKQLSLISAKSRIADPMNLGYALILAASTAEEEQASPEEKQIFRHALELFFASQREDGSWPYSRPLFHYPAVGNAYCFEYELLTQMLMCKPMRTELLPYIPQFAKAAYSLETTAFDLESTTPNAIVAWASGHHPQLKGPESWSTASVYDFANNLSRLVAEAIRRVLFAELGNIYSPPRPSRTVIAEFAPPPKFLDADLHLPGGKIASLRDTIATRFVDPIARETSIVERGERLGKRTPMSAILFGPPGTSKTKLGEFIADYLGWPLLSVDPSYVVQEGLDRIQARANHLFGMLVLAEQIVVLLDEFDEMGRDRAKSDEILSRFITTAMLPKLASINSERKIVFLLATNYVGSFDAAFSRGGRFDMRIQVMVPNLKSKLEKWPALKAALAKLAESRHECEAIVDDLTYLECEQLEASLTATLDATQVHRLIEEASKAATLYSPNDIDGKDDGGTPPDWKVTSERERIQIRIP